MGIKRRFFSEKLTLCTGKIIEIKRYRIGALNGAIFSRLGAFQCFGQFFPIIGNANPAAFVDFVFSIVGEFKVQFGTPSAFNWIHSH